MNFEIEIINKLLPCLEQVKQYQDKWNFRCPICGDGKTMYKTRAWFIRDKNWFFHCFNCGKTMSLMKFAEHVNPEIYRDYVFNKFKTGSNTGYIVYNEFKDNRHNDKELIKINELVHKHLYKAWDFDIAKTYLEHRKITQQSSNGIYIIKDFSILNKIEKYQNSNFAKEPRLVICCYNNRGLINGIVSRAISKHSRKRYINLKFDNDYILYGLRNDEGDYEIDLNKRIYVFEGSFDALTINGNGVAVNCSDLLVFDKVIGEKMLGFIDTVYCSDNDRRNIEIIAQMQKMIEYGKKVMIWPEHVDEKDINSWTINNPDKDIKSFIDNNTYQGLEAMLMLKQWKKR